MSTRRTAGPPESTDPRARGAQSKSTGTARGKTPSRGPVSADDRRALIAEAAYLRAERRGFAPGHETEDWLAAEAEVDGLLQIGPGGGAPQ